MTESTKGNSFAIQTFGLSRKFGDLVAVNSIDLCIKDWVLGYTSLFFALGTFLFRWRMVE